jgi:hypothetical protein
MSSKFADFIKAQKIDPRRIAAASYQLERLTPEDRAKKLKRRQSKGSAPAEGGAAPAEKPRSGRPVTAPLLDRALAGKPLPGPGKTRILRAVNRVLEQKKKDPVDLRALF